MWKIYDKKKPGFPDLKNKSLYKKNYLGLPFSNPLPIAYISSIAI